MTVPYYPTPPKTVRTMLKTAKVRPGDIVYDLGCGDGRILITAVNMFRADRAVGYETREDLCGAALSEIERQRVRHRVKLVKGDLFDADLYEATVITLYLDEPTNQRLKLKLEREARDGTRIVSHAYEIKGWKAARKKTVQGNTVYLYRVPESIYRERKSDGVGKEEAGESGEG